MQGLAVLVFVGWLVSTPWAMILVAGVILAGFAFVAWIWTRHTLEIEPAGGTWTRVEPRFEPWTTQEEPTDRSKLLHRMEQLEEDLKDAQGQIATLQAQNERLERDLQVARTAKPNSRSSPLFRRVGLDEDVPEWVARAVRREYRRRLHPDAHPAARKIEAERRFKLAEGVFEEIWRVRGFQP